MFGSFLQLIVLTVAMSSSVRTNVGTCVHQACNLAERSNYIIISIYHYTLTITLLRELARSLAALTQSFSLVYCIIKRKILNNVQQTMFLKSHLGRDDRRISSAKA